MVVLLHGKSFSCWQPVFLRALKLYVCGNKNIKKTIASRIVEYLINFTPDLQHKLQAHKVIIRFEFMLVV